MVTPHLAELLTFWLCGFEVSVAEPLPNSWLSPLWNRNSVRVQSGSPNATERFVCAFQAGDVWGCPSGNSPWVLNTEELEEKTLSAWRTQHSQCRGHWSTCTLVHTHKHQMHSCIHASTLSLPHSLLHTHIHTRTHTVALSASLFCSHQYTQWALQQHCFAHLPSPPLSCQNSTVGSEKQRSGG